MTFLKLEEKTVLKFDFETQFYDVLEADLLPCSIRGRLINTANLKAVTQSELVKAWFNNQEALSYFFLNRSLSVNRENAKYILNQLNVRQNNDFDTRYKVMLLCKALSVSDNYWITNDDSEKWEDVRLDTHPLHETLQQIALFGRSLSITGKLRTPELTTQGAYAKAWYREDNQLYLFKGNSKGGNECEREVLASKILDCFNVPHVDYVLTKKDDLIVCKCKNMNFDNTSIVDSIEAERWITSLGLDFYLEAKHIDSEMFYKTIVMDYLLSNSDRHGGNWGFYMNNQTGKLVCMHPLFDHNNAFDESFMNDSEGGICQLMPGHTQKESALYAIKHCDLRCTKPIERSMFINDKMYESFMTRAVALGLYEKQKISALDKLFCSNKEAYVPVVLKEDNSDEYWKKARALLKRKDEVKRITKKDFSISK